MASASVLPSGATTASLLERAAEIAAMRALIDAARGGDGRFVVIEGSAGIGKTRLLDEARAIAGSAGMRVLTARGGELEHEFAFGIVRQLFEPLLATAPADERAELFAGAAGLSAPLFAESGLAETRATGDVSFAMLHGLYWLAANAAFRQPSLLLVDDVHWGDAPSLRWLAYIVRRLEGLPLVLAVGTRPPQQAEEGALLTELLADRAAAVLRPATLGLESVAILARDVFSAEPDMEFCAACHDATGGNPLYLRALLTTLAADGLAPTAESSPRVYEVGPEPVARVVSLRLSRLPPEAGALAQAIAVLGRGAELRLAAVLAGLERSVAVSASAALARAELLRVEPALEFTHPVVRAAIYETIGPVERAEAHRRAAGLLAEAGAEPEQATSQLLRVAPASDPFVSSVLREAAEHVLARGGASEAVVYLRRALVEPPPASERGDVLAELGIVERGIDLPAAVEHLREAVRLTEQPGRFAAVALECGRALGYTGFNNAEAIEVLRAAIGRAGSEHSDLREQATADLINACWTESEFYPTAKELLGRLHEEDLAGGLGSDMLRATLAHYELRRGRDRARASALAKLALASGALENHSSQELYYALDVLRAASEIEAALAAYERALTAARRRGDLLNVAGLLSFRGWLLIEQGDLPSAEPDVREGLEFSVEHGAPVHVMYSAVCLANFLLERGEVDETELVLNRLGLGEQLPENFHFLIFLDARGRLRLAQRKPEASLADFEAIGRVAEQLEMRNPGEWPWRSSAAAALLALGRKEDAHELAAEDLELARRWGAPRPIGIALRILGLIEDGVAGEQRLGEALDVLAPSPARLEHAKALIDLGAAVRRRNERAEARKLLRQGIELAHGCGATALVERANEELAATGARPRKMLLTGLESLTASERRVAQLAAEEMSNKEIAQALFVTVKTVEVHLSNVYRKLEIGSRRQLPAALVGARAGEAVLAGS
jgi:DNA-binding CsgD family transcriptional regulator/tetratricopeptide (TPR) repeat protein